MFTRCPLLSLSLIGLVGAGCARMQVRKITLSDRAAGTDCDIKGFRYHLSRPYIVVKQKVTITESKRLLYVDLTRPENDQWRHLLGRSGASAPAGLVASLEFEPTLTGAATVPGVDAVTDSEWSEIRRAIQLSQDDDPPGIAQVQATNPDPPGTPPGLLEFPKGGGGIDAATQYYPDPQPASLGGAIEVVYLPDLDEQYAVHNCNCLARSKYNLQFRDGWELVSVNGSFDSTEVAVEVLDTVEAAIKAVRVIETNALQRRKIASGKDYAPAASGLLADPGNRDLTYLLLEVKETLSIRPGVYRVNKPWETNPQELVGSGLLAQMGLPTVVETTVTVATSEDQTSIVE